MNLPADSEGVKGWFFGSDISKLPGKEPLRWQIRKTAESSEALQLSNPVIFDVQIQLFNLAGLAYTMVKNRPKSKFICDKFLLTSGLRVEFEIKEEVNDTHVVVLSS